MWGQGRLLSCKLGDKWDLTSGLVRHGEYPNVKGATELEIVHVKQQRHHLI